MVRIGDLYGALDPMWIEHGVRVGMLAERVGRSFGLTSAATDDLVIAARLHDVGKADIDRAVLAKPDALTPQEWTIVRTHPQIGFDALRGAVAAEVAQMVLYHHERFDGTGYPYGLAADHIPLGARILATIDAFDAMVSERPYSAGVSVEQALSELDRCGGSQFNPDVVEIVTWALSQEFFGGTRHHRRPQRSLNLARLKCGIVCDDATTVGVGASFDSVLQAAQEGSPWAWELLFKELAPKVRGYVAVRGAADPDDLVSETFIQLARNVGRFEGTEANFRSWVFTIDSSTSVAPAPAAGKMPLRPSTFRNTTPPPTPNAWRSNDWANPVLQSFLNC